MLPDMAVVSRGVAAFLLPIAIPVIAFLVGRPRALPPADFTFVLPKENATLDPTQASSVSDGWLVNAIFEGLVAFDPQTLEVKPACAKSFEISSDGTRYTFSIDEHARWSDGREVLADDFVAGFGRLLDPATASPNAGLLWNVRGAKAASEGRGALTELGVRAVAVRVLEIELEQPLPYFPQILCHFALMPARRDVLERLGEHAFDPAGFVGNGPYRPTLRRVRDRVRLERNPFHRRADSIAFATIDALAIESKATALNLFLKHQVDWVNALPQLSVPSLRGRPELDLSTNLGTIFLRMNVSKAPLDDRELRRAIDFAIDRTSLCTYVYKTGEKPAASLVPPSLPGYAPPTRTREDRTLAREHFARSRIASAGSGFPEIELLHAADETARAAAEAIAAQLHDVLGLTVRATPQEFKVFVDSQKNLRYQLCLANWIGDYPDPTNFLDLFRAGSGNNRTGYRDPNYDALLDRAERQLDRSQRMSALLDAEEYLLANGPIVPIAFRGQANLIAPDIVGFSGNLLDLHPLDRLSRRR